MLLQADTYGGVNASWQTWTSQLTNDQHWMRGGGGLTVPLVVEATTCCRQSLKLHLLQWTHALNAAAGKGAIPLFSPGYGPPCPSSPPKTNHNAFTGVHFAPKYWCNGGSRLQAWKTFWPGPIYFKIGPDKQNGTLSSWCDWRLWPGEWPTQPRAKPQLEALLC